MNISIYPEHNENNVPLGERVIFLEGKLPDSVIEKIKNLAPGCLEERKGKVDDDFYEELEGALNHYLALPASDNLLHFAASFAYADLPVGKEFGVVFPWADKKSGIECRSILKAVIFEWEPLLMVGTSAGHRFVCLLDFPDGIPELVTRLKIVDGFMQTKLEDCLCLCSLETWRQLSEKDNI